MQPSQPREPETCTLATHAHQTERLQRLTEQLARCERAAALGSLAASTAHNLRNPLSALLTGLPALRKRLDGRLDDASAELLDVLMDCAQRIERMTLDLLNLSRSDRDPRANFAPGSGLLACARVFGARLDNTRVELQSDVDAQAMTSGRAGDINHVFMNVLDNALRAVEGQGRIRVCGHVEGADYVVRVGDSGPGIAPELLGSVFEDFWTTRPAGEGTGLGLSIARKIVEEHGGSIEAGRSELGGALFTIRLPLRAAERAVADMTI